LRRCDSPLASKAVILSACIRGGHELASLNLTSGRQRACGEAGCATHCGGGGGGGSGSGKHHGSVPILSSNRPSNVVIMPSSPLVAAAAVAAVLLCGTVLVAGTRNYDEKIRIFLVPHSHCDALWRETFDDYYAQHVRSILDGVVDALLRDRERVFNWAETAFFARWWQEQSPMRRLQVRELVRNEQLEFVGGGWVQHDEALTTFSGIIDQMTVGHRFLSRELGVVPRFAWQIDPFGHSTVNAELFARMGFEAQVGVRVHDAVKWRLSSGAGLDFVWLSEQGQCARHGLLTHLLGSGRYVTPQGFNFADDSTEKVSEFNVDALARALVDVARSMRADYRMPLVLVPIGDDFKWADAEFEFANLERVARRINSRTNELNATAEFALLSTFFDAVAALNRTFPSYSGDLVQYRTSEGGPLRYWVGFFSSRLPLKALARELEALLRACDIVQALVFGRTQDARTLLALHQGIGAQLRAARETVALVQHHDAITGTSREHVMVDLVAELSRTERELRAVLSSITGAAMSNATAAVSAAEALLRLASAPEGSTLPLVFWNALSAPQALYVTVPLARESVAVLAPSGARVMADVVKRYEWEASPYVRLTAADSPKFPYSVVFRVDAPALSAVTYTLVASAEAGGVTEQVVQWQPHSQALNITVSNSLLTLTFCAHTGRLCQMRRMGDGNQTFVAAVEQNFVNVTPSFSGAYVTLLDGPMQPLARDPVAELTIHRGRLVHRVVQQFSSALVQMTSVFLEPSGSDSVAARYPQLHAAEVQSIVGPLSTEADQEILLRYSLRDWSNRTALFTDANAWRRVRRPRHPHYRSANMYPLVSTASLRDEDSGVDLSVAAPHSIGVCSHEPGELSLLVHRFALRDDSLGLDEPLLTFAPVNVRHLLMIHRADSASRRLDTLGAWLLNPLQLVTGHLRQNGGVAPTSTTPSAAASAPAAPTPSSQPLVGPSSASPTLPTSSSPSPQPQHSAQTPSSAAPTTSSAAPLPYFLGLRNASAWPEDARVISLEVLSVTPHLTVLLRLANIAQVASARTLQVDVSQLFSGRALTGIQEVSLTAATSVSAARRSLNWRVSDEMITPQGTSNVSGGFAAANSERCESENPRGADDMWKRERTAPDASPLLLSLEHGALRTFIVTLSIDFGPLGTPAPSLVDREEDSIVFAPAPQRSRKLLHSANRAVARALQPGGGPSILS
jgi:hypothetical protein